jgi:hypothetical protein
MVIATPFTSGEKVSVTISILINIWRKRQRPPCKTNTHSRPTAFKIWCQFRHMARVSFPRQPNVTTLSHVPFEKCGNLVPACHQVAVSRGHPPPFAGMTLPSQGRHGVAHSLRTVTILSRLRDSFIHQARRTTRRKETLARALARAHGIAPPPSTQVCKPHSSRSPNTSATGTAGAAPEPKPHP